MPRFIGFTQQDADRFIEQLTKFCDVCGDNPSVGECCCGVTYCGPTCQEAHLDEVSREEEEASRVWAASNPCGSDL